MPWCCGPIQIRDSRRNSVATNPKTPPTTVTAPEPKTDVKTAKLAKKVIPNTLGAINFKKLKELIDKSPDAKNSFVGRDHVKKLLEK